MVGPSACVVIAGKEVIGLSAHVHVRYENAHVAHDRESVAGLRSEAT